MKICPTCQREYPDDLTFCQEDGADLVVRSQRRRVLPAPTYGPSPIRNGRKHGVRKQGSRVLQKALVAGGGVFLLLVARVWWIGYGGWINTPLAAIYPWTFPPQIVYRRNRAWRWPGANIYQPQQSSSGMSGGGSALVPPTRSPAEEAATRPEIERLYQRSEQGFRDKNVSEYFCYTGRTWTFTNENGTRETRDKAWSYMSKLLQSPPSGKEYTTAVRREVIKISPLIGDSDGYLVHVWVVVSKSTGREVRYKQTDTWIDLPENPGLLCVGEVRGVWQEDSGE
jgi:hypothetical protein